MALFPSRLQPDSATIVGVLTAGGVYLIYNNAVPSLADLREMAPHDESAEKERKKAAWTSALLIATVFVISRDVNSYIISGGALVVIDLMHKHANMVHPMTQQIDEPTEFGPSTAATYNLPDYQEAQGQ